MFEAAFRSSTQILERAPIRWIGNDTEMAALKVIERMQRAVDRMTS